MKFIKLLKFDMKQGIKKNYALFICPLLLAVPAVLDTLYKIRNYINTEGNENAAYSLGDVWMSIYGGMEEYIPSPDNPFNFPVIWSILIMIGAFLVLNYPMKEMLGVGAQYLVQGGSRKMWWASKILWNVTTTLMFHMIIFGVIFIGCVVSSVPIRFHINIYLIEVLFEFKRPVDMYYVNSIPVTVIVLPILVSLCMNLIQMTISLFINPIYSFLLNAMLLISSAFIMNIGFVYNYAIPLRYKWIYTGGFNHLIGYAVILFLMVIFVIAGMVRFSRYDVIRKGENSSGD